MKSLFRKPLLLLAALATGAQLAVGDGPVIIAQNLYVGTAADVVLGFDGLPVRDGSHIEFRAMDKVGTDWKAYNPQHEDLESLNPLLTTSSVGAGLIPSSRGRGRFAACVSGLAQNSAYVARLFDGPTPGESVAYCDSLPFTYGADGIRPVTNVVFGTWQSMDGTPIDTDTDTDGDGLPDSVETLSALTLPDNWDTDGDGFSDGFEYTHDMDPLYPYQLAIQLEIETPDAETCLAAGLEQESLYALSWAALAEKTYQVEFQPTMRPSQPEDEWKVIAEEKVSETTNRFMFNLENIEDYEIFKWVRSHSAFFRVRQMDSSADEETASGEDSLGE